MTLVTACFVVNTLLLHWCYRNLVNSFCLLSSLQAQALYWKKQANMNFRVGDDVTAKQYYKLALQCAPEQAVEVKRECFDTLADICFENEEFSECTKHGEKGCSV